MKQAAALQVVEIGFESNPSQGHYHFHILEPVHFAIEIRRAIGQFLRQRLVVGRRAADRGGDVEVLQFESVRAVRGRRLIGESGLVQDRIHEFAGGIAGERTSGAVGAVGAGSEAEHQHARVGIAEARDGLSPIFPIR